MEKQQLLTETQSTLAELISLLSSFNEEALNTAPARGGWTAGQVGDHLRKSYGVTEILNAGVTDTGREPDLYFAELDAIFLDFDRKYQSPRETIPTSKPIDKKRLTGDLDKKRAELAAFIAASDLTKTCTLFALPGSKPYTRLEWIYFIIVHTRRHIRQLEQIARDVLHTEHAG